MTRLYVRIYEFFRNRRPLLFLIVAVWVAACGAIVSGIRFDEDITSAFPDDPQIRKANAILKNSPFLERLYIVVKYSENPGDSTLQLSAVADRLEENIQREGSRYFREFRTRVDEEAAAGLIDLVYNNIPYFLEKADYLALDSMLQPAAVDEAMENGYNALLSPAGFATRKFFIRDPLGITWRGMKKMERLNVSDNFVLDDGYIVTRDRRNLMVFALPAQTSGDAASNKQMIASLDAAIRSTENEFAGAEIIYYGGPAMSVANARQVRNDIFFTVGLAMIVLVVSLSLYFRKWYAFPLLMLPVMFGALTAMAVLVLVKGSVSAISLGIGSVMLGIILDYSLHTYTHFRENGNPKEVVHDVAALLMATSGTNVLAFLCLLTLSSALMNDLGLFAAVSIGSAAVFALTVFPHLMGKPVQLKPAPGLLARVAAFPLDRVKWLFPVICLVLAASFYFAPKTSFNADLDKLSYIPDDLKKAEDHLDAISEFKLKKIYVVSEGATLDEALEKNQEYLQVFDSLQGAGTIDGYSSVSTSWPSEKQRATKLQQWKNFWTDERMELLQQRVDAACRRFRMKPDAFAPFFSWLREPPVYRTGEAMEVLRPLFFSDLAQTGVNGVSLINVLRVKEENKPQVYAAFGKSDLAFDNKFIFKRLVQVLQNDLQLLEWLSFLLVLGVVFITFRRLELALATMIPMLSAWLITLGTMGALGLTFNIFNIIICTFIFGLGIDYSIFLGRGILDQYRGKTGNLRASKMSIILSLMVTLLSIGVMIFAKHPALRSIAAISLLGMFVTGFIAFTVQPVLFRFFLFWKGIPRRIALTFSTVFCTVVFFYLFIFYSILLLLFGLIFIRTKLLPVTVFERFFSWGSRFIISWGFLLRKNVSELDRTVLSRPGIIIANHQSSLDLLFIFGLSGKIRVVTKDRIFRIPVWGQIARMMGYYPASEAAAPGFAERVKADLANGYSILFFAEGSRSEDFTIHRFKKGAFLLAAETGADIIPLLIHGTGVCMPKGSGLLGPGTVAMKSWTRISPGDPRFPQEYSARATAICQEMRSEFYSWKKRVEQPWFIRRALMPRYIYRAPEVRAAYRKLLRRQEIYAALDLFLDEKETILLAHAGYGELASYLLFRSGMRKIYAWETDPGKSAELEWLKGWTDRLHIPGSPGAAHEPQTLIWNTTPDALQAAIHLIPPSVNRIILFGKATETDGWKQKDGTSFVVLERNGDV